jgi:glycine betaine/proline transport system permease protein
MDGMADFITAWKIPVGKWGRSFFNFLTDNFEFVFDAIADSLKFFLDSMIDGLLWLPPLVLVLAIALIGWRIQKSWKLALGIVLGLVFIINQGLWKETVETLVLVISAAFMSMLIGVPIGIWLAHRPRLYTYVQPILDLMQTMPTFVYLIPVLILFGLGLAPGLLVTIIFASPAPIRLTYLGITSVPKPMVEAGLAFGASKAAASQKGRIAGRPADHHGRADTMHHAVAVHGCHRRSDRRQRAGQAGGARTQHRQHSARP